MRSDHLNVLGASTQSDISLVNWTKVSETEFWFARLLYDQGRRSEFEELIRSVVQWRKEQLRPENVATLKAMDDLVDALLASNKFAEMEILARLIIDRAKHALGKTDYRTFMAYGTLALALSGTDRHEEAEKLYVGSLEEYEVQFESTDRVVLVVKHNHVSNLMVMNKVNEAEVIYRDLLNARRPEHREWMVAARNLALLLQEQKKYKESEELYRKVLQQRKDLLGAIYPGTEEAQLFLASVSSRPRKDLGESRSSAGAVQRTDQGAGRRS